jgi:hypothetical protein
MGIRKFVVLAATCIAAVGLSASTGTAAKSVGGCPLGPAGYWQLVTVESLGIDPETASGIPSLDGNADGWTCIALIPANETSVIAGGFVFRDNTVGASG